MNLFGIGPFELALVLILGLVFLGPEESARMNASAMPSACNATMTSFRRESTENLSNKAPTCFFTAATVTDRSFAMSLLDLPCSSRSNTR